MMNKIFKLEYGIAAKVVNYDDTSGLYIYKIPKNGEYGYASREYILKNEIIDRGDNYRAINHR